MYVTCNTRFINDQALLSTGNHKIDACNFVIILGSAFIELVFV